MKIKNSTETNTNEIEPNDTQHIETSSFSAIKTIGKDPKKIAILAIIIAVIVTLLGVGIANAIEAENQRNIEFYKTHIFDNTTVGGVDVSKMTAEEASNVINEQLHSVSADVRDGETITTFTLSDAGVKDVETGFFDAIIENQDSLEWKQGCSKTEIELPELTYNRTMLLDKANTLECVTGEDRIDAVNATLELKDGEFYIEPGKEGNRVDASKLTDEILHKLSGGAWTAPVEEKPAKKEIAEKKVYDIDEDGIPDDEDDMVDADHDNFYDEAADIKAAHEAIDAAEEAAAQEEARIKAEEKAEAEKAIKVEDMPLSVAAQASVKGENNTANNTIDTSGYYVHPKWWGDEPEFEEAQEKAEKWLGAEIDYTIDMIPHAAKVDRKVIEKFITVNQDDIDIEFNEEAIKEWLQEIGHEYDTVGTTRHYVSPTGEEMDLSGGHFGWVIDEEGELPLLEEDIVKGGTIARDISYAQVAPGPKNGQEWGNFYVDIDRYDQTGRVVKNGEVIYEWRFVSGSADPSHETQTGFYDVFWKASPHVMVGEIQANGQPEYQTPCDFFTCFNKNGSAVHDATWRGNWSTEAWLSGDGSHGCLNSSYGDAQWVYENVDYGTPFIVHD